MIGTLVRGARTRVGLEVPFVLICGAVYGTAIPEAADRLALALRLLVAVLIVSRCSNTKTAPNWAAVIFGVFSVAAHIESMGFFPDSFTRALGTSPWISYGSLLLISAYQSIPFGASMYLFRRLECEVKWYGPACGGALLAVFFAVWPGIFPGALYQPYLFHPALSAPAALLGELGYAWLINTFIFALGTLASSRSRAGLLNAGAWTVFALLVFAICGFIRDATAVSSARTIKTLIVQESILLGRAQEIVPAVRQRLARAPGTRLVVFSEHTLVYDTSELISEARQVLEELQQLAREKNVYLLFSMVREIPTGKLITAVLMAPDGTLAFHEKQSLLPFAEYVPSWAHFFGNFGLSPERLRNATYVPGTRDDKMVVDGVPIRVLTCYESITAGSVFNPFRGNEQLVILQSNLDDFVDPARALWLHMALDAHVAVVQGVPFLRVLRGGGSTVVGSRGQVDQRMLASSWSTPFYQIDLHPERQGFAFRGLAEFAVFAALAGSVIFALLALLSQHRLAAPRTKAQ